MKEVTIQVDNAITKSAYPPEVRAEMKFQADLYGINQEEPDNPGRCPTPLPVHGPLIIL
ncbi:MAG: hypothetical protein WCR47_05005 [Desulfoplanes sp.]|nr:hypothetical protein [Desulfoplanes sp.]